MKIETMNDLYIEELRDLYSCESQIVGALPKMIEGTETAKLKDALKAHLTETRGQITRLDSIFKDLEAKPTGEKCEATAGLLKEADGALEDIGKGVLRDAAIIGSGQRIEHYEMSAYGTARAYAELLGFKDHVKLLTETLDEEMNANRVLNEIALSEVNTMACAGTKETAGSRK